MEEEKKVVREATHTAQDGVAETGKLQEGEDWRGRGGSH